MSDVKDTGWLQSPSQILTDLDGEEVAVGFFDADEAQKAYFHEFGTDDLEGTAFIRSVFDAAVPRYEQAIGQGAADAITEGGSVTRAMHVAGEMVAEDIRRSITDHGLVETGAMRDAVEVRRGGEGGE